jgi:hypothetical protein
VIDQTKRWKPPSGGKTWRRPKADFVLIRAQRKEVLQWIKMLMFLDGYATNLSRRVNLSTLQVLGLKSHDFHIWIERILLATVRGYVPEHVWLALTKLRYFFRQLCAKELSRTMIVDLEWLTPMLLCKLEKIFPPVFFNPSNIWYFISHMWHEWGARAGTLVLSNREMSKDYSKEM